MSTFKLRLKPIAPRGETPVLKVELSTTALALEMLVKTYESTPLGKWKMVLMPRKGGKTLQEIQGELDADEALTTDEARQTAMRRLLRENQSAMQTPTVLQEAERTMESYGITAGEERIVEIVLDFGACHMNRSLNPAKEDSGEACRRDAGGRCSCLNENEAV